ncbi:MAG: hypothetical protein IIC74_07415 [Bacteroidetes bacterium]|nr:hypothetical protein [Bacteroidota bacterium]
MKNFILCLIIAVLIFRCSTNDNSLPQNANPGILRIESISFQGKEVTIDWNDVEDKIVMERLYRRG